MKEDKYNGIQLGQRKYTTTDKHSIQMNEKSYAIHGTRFGFR